MKLVVIRYDELSLKGKNKNIFLEHIKQNIEFFLKKYKLNFKKTFFRDHVEFFPNKEQELNILLNILKKTFGISNIIIVNEFSSNIKMLNFIENKYKNENLSFKVKVKKREIGLVKSSEDFKLEVAKIVLQNSNMKVDVHNPKELIFIETFKAKVWLYEEKIKGLGGLPVGSNGRALSLLSGGFDSPVASLEVMKRGVGIDFITFLTPPFTTLEIENKIINLVKIMNDYQINGKLYIVDISSLLSEINHISNNRYNIIIMRRFFMKMVEKLVHKEKYKFVVTGDSLGQVASQTPESLYVISSATNVLIVRPLITFNKIDIINLAKKYGTYEISKIQCDDVCSLFVPKNPITTPNLQNILELEKELELSIELIDMILSKRIRIIEQ